MSRIVLRYLNAPMFVLLVMIAIALQTSIFNSYPLMYLQPDLVIIAVIWCALRRDLFEGGVLTLIFGRITELHSSAPAGMFLITYMSVYLLARVTNKLFVIPNLQALVIMTMGASIFWKIEYMGVLHALGLSHNQWRHALVLLPFGAVMAGVAAIWIFRWLEKFDWATNKDPRAAAQMEGEMQLDGEL